MSDFISLYISYCNMTEAEVPVYEMYVNKAVHEKAVLKVFLKYRAPLNMQFIFIMKN